MNQSRMSKLLIFLTRISLGWIFFYAGITKVINPNWSAAGFLRGAKTFPAFFHWMLDPNILPVINFLNEWGLTLIGISLILGIFVRWSALFGALLMVLYYLPALDFPHPNANSYIVDDHIIYLLVLLFLAAINAGKYWGIDGWIRRTNSAM